MVSERDKLEIFLKSSSQARGTPRLFQVKNICTTDHTSCSRGLAGPGASLNRGGGGEGGGGGCRVTGKLTAGGSGQTLPTEFFYAGKNVKKVGFYICQGNIF